MSTKVHTEDNTRNLIDLTTMVAKQPELTSTDIVIIMVSGGVGFLGKKAFEYFFPRAASVEEQIQNLIRLLEAGGRAGVKKMTFRLSAKTDFEMALGGRQFSIKNSTASTIDLEVEFTSHH